MNGWQFTFSERFDYSRFTDIVLPLRLFSDKANQILLRAKVDTPVVRFVFFSGVTPNCSTSIRKRETSEGSGRRLVPSQRTGTKSR